MVSLRTDDGTGQAEAVADLGRLFALARDRQPEARRAVARGVGALVLGPAGTLSGSERVLALDILALVLQDVEMAVRRELAERLAEETEVPRALLMALLDDELEIARPVLMRSEALSDEDLVAIIRSRTREHRLAIAGRRRLSPPVGDALVESCQEDGWERGEPVALALLNNPGASLSARAMRHLSEAAAHRRPLCRPLLSRPELTPDLAARLYWLISVELRRFVLERFALPREQLDKALQGTLARLIEACRMRQPPAPEVTAMAGRLAEGGAATPPVLIHVLRAGQIGLFETLFAGAGRLPLPVVRRIITEPGGEPLAVACRAQRIEKGHFASIFLLSRAARPGEQVVDPRELSRVLAFFDKVMPAMAEAAAEAWRRQPETAPLLPPPLLPLKPAGA